MIAVTLTEQQFGDLVIELAQMRGWHVAHFRPARVGRGWRTAMQGDVGFPDLVLARNGKVIFAELKAEHGRLGPTQDAWLAALGAGQDTVHGVHVWRPRDWSEIVEVLA